MEVQSLVKNYYNYTTRTYFSNEEDELSFTLDYLKEINMIINEKLINIFSNLAGLSLHDDISSYGFYSEWYGFNPYFTAYTALWFVLGYILLLFDKIHLYRVQSLEFSLKVYSVLGMYYFVFGFGGFSNRWGFAAWLFIPILQATIIMSSKLTEKVKFFIGAFFIFPYINYVYHLL